MFTHEIRNGIAFVTFDSGGMNTLSAAAVEALDRTVKELRRDPRQDAAGGRRSSRATSSGSAPAPTSAS